MSSGLIKSALSISFGTLLILSCAGSHLSLPEENEGEGGPASEESEEAGDDLPTEEGDFVADKMVALRETLPGIGSEGFVRPEDCEGGETSLRRAFQDLVLTLWNGNDDGALAQAEVLHYDLVRFIDTAGDKAEYYLLTEKNSENTGQGIYAINPSGLRNLVIEAPHPLFDADSELVAAQIFRDTSAKGLSIAGTHRCADSEESSCDGTTTACGAEGAYRVSDAAHFTCNFFQAVHETLSDMPERPVILQIHGFSQGLGEPEAILSDGLSHTTTAAEKVLALAASLKAQLDAKGDADGVASCQADSPDEDGDGIEVSSLLCATQNVQGRYTNGSTIDACTVGSSVSSDRFIHLELSDDLRHADGTADDVGPEDLVEAIKGLF